MTVIVHTLSWKQIAKHVGVGMGAASFWRGAWYLLDDHLFPDSPEASAASSWGLGVVGMAASQGLVHKCDMLKQKYPHRIHALKVARFGALYTIAISCVLVWRGTWLGWDVLYEKTHPRQSQCGTHVKSTDPGHATTSGILSHMLAVSALVGTGVFASVLAPPASTSIIRDLTVKAAATAKRTTHYASSSSTTSIPKFLSEWSSPNAGHAIRGYSSVPRTTMVNKHLQSPSRIETRSYSTTKMNPLRRYI